MSVLVTGGAGYIGSHMVLELLDAGEKVVVVDNLTTGFRWAVDPRAALVVGDVAGDDLVRTVIRKHNVGAIIHFAGSIVVPESVADPLGYYHNNTAKSRSLMATAVATGVKHFIFSSTAAVYGNPKENPVSEMAAPAPMSPYGSSKLMTEVMLADTARAHDFRFVALRYFNVAGADPKGRSGQSTPRATHLIKVACEMRWLSARTWKSLAPITRRKMAPACAITSTSKIWRGPICRRLNISAKAALPIFSTAAIPRAIRSTRLSRPLRRRRA